MCEIDKSRKTLWPYRNFEVLKRNPPSSTDKGKRKKVCRQLGYFQRRRSFGEIDISKQSVKAIHHQLKAMRYRVKAIYHWNLRGICSDKSIRILILALLASYSGLLLCRRAYIMCKIFFQISEFIPRRLRYIWWETLCKQTHTVSLKLWFHSTNRITSNFIKFLKIPVVS